MKKILSTIGILSVLLPVAASARSVEQLEVETFVAQSFEDGTITNRIIAVHPFVAPNLAEYRESDVVTRRKANYRANSFHCTAYKQLKAVPTGVCAKDWNGK